jgi:anaphase-promoting complex subunit 5
MTRFLTPSKIGLLALIELYTEAVVPTASTIQILSFIINQLLPATVKSQSRDSVAISPLSSTLPFILDLKSFEALLTPHTAAAGVPGRTLWDYFLTKLWSIDSLHALHEFFAARANLLARTRDELKKDAEMGLPPPSPDVIYLSRTSPFGSFVRRSKVEFDRLTFNDSQALWTSFARWRAESKTYMARRHESMGRWAGDQALEEGLEEWGLEATEMLELVANGGLSLEDTGEGCVSTDDVEKLLEFQVERMQS